MNTATNANLQRIERPDLAGTYLAPTSAESGCWHHVQWPLGAGAGEGGSRFRGGITPKGSLRKLAAFRLPAELPGGKLRPGALR